MPRSRICRLLRSLGPALAGGALVGCVGGGAPDDPYALPGRSLDFGAAGADGEEGEAPEAGSNQSHYPLIDGASWTYRHTSLTDRDWNETATMAAARDGSFILSDEEDAQGEQTQSTLVVTGSRVFRTRKQVLVDGEQVLETAYDPAFLRYDEAWTRAGTSVTLDDAWTQRCVIESAASSCAAGAVETGVTTHVYTVLDLASRVTVPAGEFAAVKVQRDNPTDFETKLFWFAAGVGKVREENLETGAVEELSAYEIP